MSKCINCNNQCIKMNKACSLKCKLLGGIEKNANDCWIWQRRTGNNKYGYVRWLGKWISAHRASYNEFIGPIAQDKVVCHKCDTPLCINPNHLYLATQRENILDAVKKRRMCAGERNHFHKLTDIQINEMRILKKEGFSYPRLARIFNCSAVHVVEIIKNRCRKE